MFTTAAKHIVAPVPQRQILQSEHLGTLNMNGQTAITFGQIVIIQSSL